MTISYRWLAMTVLGCLLSNLFPRSFGAPIQPGAAAATVVASRATAGDPQSVLRGKNDYYQLETLVGESAKSRFLHVDQKKVFFRLESGENYSISVDQLSPDSAILAAEWRTEFGARLSGKQSAYLKEIKPWPIEKLQPGSSKTTNSNGAPQPLLDKPDSSVVWKLQKDFSDEFNSSKINTKKWMTEMSPWGDRAWTSANLRQDGGFFFIKATHEPHTQNGKKYFYKLGILQSHKKTTYGFFEARIKGCSKNPGLCPAFWLYSNGKDLNPELPKVTYSEIDIVELQQNLYEPELKRQTDVSHIDCNLHTRIINEQGKEIWQRPNDLPDVCKHYYEAPWDPRDDYHVYACENTPEKITWYIDGEKVAEENNLYWHLPMSVTLTLELRPPLIAWAGVDGRRPVPEASTAEGFPTEMSVDYIRSWTRSETPGN